MAERMTPEKREAVLKLLSQGFDRDTIAQSVGVTRGQVSAVIAHVTMGTYHLPQQSPANTIEVPNRTPTAERSRLHRTLVPIGTNTESGELVTWNPDPQTGSANPHVLVLGESGFGKTYAITCMLAELAMSGISSIVFDYAQGFSPESLPKELGAYVRVAQIEAAQQGLNLNPLQSFPSDIHGATSVAQRVADTFKRVYPGIGVQQHAIVRQAVIDVLANAGSGAAGLPSFGEVQKQLESYSADPDNPNRRMAATVASHISTVFVFNTFRRHGQSVNWAEILGSEGKVFVINLKGLETSLEKAVTEFLLWNLIGYVESTGPGPLKCFIVLDEAHKLSFDQGSPVEKLLREGRKFGLGLILASQQAEDFSSVAFANTATKLIFQVGDESGSLARQVYRKVKNAHTLTDIYNLLTRMPRGYAYAVSENVGSLTKVTPIAERLDRWKN